MSNISFGGNLTKDPSLAYTKDNTAVCNLSVAENRRYRGADGEWASDVTYYDCSVFGQQAIHTHESLSKGDGVIVIGRMQFRSWDDNGKRRTKLEVRVFDIGASTKFARLDVKKVAREDTVAVDPDAVPEAEAPAVEATEPEANLAPTGTDDII